VSKLGAFLSGLAELEAALAREYSRVGARHAADQDVYHQCATFAKQAVEHADKLGPIADRYQQPTEEGLVFWSLGTQADTTDTQPEMLPPGIILLRDLRTLLLAAEGVAITWVMAGQAAQAARDPELIEVVGNCRGEVELQGKWMTTRIKVAAPQALVTA
jgi:hypothetical protein